MTTVKFLKVHAVISFALLISMLILGYKISPIIANLVVSTWLIYLAYRKVITGIISKAVLVLCYTLLALTICYIILILSEVHFQRTILDQIMVIPLLVGILLPVAMWLSVFILSFIHWGKIKLS